MYAKDKLLQTVIIIMIIFVIKESYLNFDSTIPIAIPAAILCLSLGQLAGRPVGRSAGRPVGHSAGWPVGRLAGRPAKLKILPPKYLNPK